MSPDYDIPKVDLRAIRMVVLGAMWAAVTGVSAVGLLIYDSWDHGAVVDWHQAGRLVWKAALGGIVMYWRKHEALLRTPPGKIAISAEESGPGK